MKKFIIFLFLFISFFSVLKTEAFLGESPDLNLYKEIDNWYSKLQLKQLEYELKWWDNWNFTDYINKQLKDNGYKLCLKNLSIEDLNQIITNEDIGLLNKKIDKECSWIKWWIPINYISKYIIFFKKIYNDAKKRAEEKSKHIYELAQLWLYVDWNTENSPFDLINDLREIDKIIFWEEIEYNWEENSTFLDKYFENPFLDINQDNNQNENNNTGSINNNWNNDSNNNSSDDNNTIINDENNNNIENIPDWNNYVCPQSNDQSWLDENELTKLKEDFNKNIWTNKYKYNFNTSKSWHLKLPDTNKIDTKDALKWDKNFYLKLNKWWYNSVNDNSSWWCPPDQYYCITIEFITHNQKLLWYWKTKSILNLLEVSNWHLKKAVNTSLLQAKMWTNNFENILRDLDFSEMFHMGIIISKKSPPILNLETKKEEILYKTNPRYKKILASLYRSQWLDYKRKNDITILQKKEYNEKSIYNLEWVALTKINEQKKDQDKFFKNLEKENNYFINHKTDLINQWLLNDFYQELLEYEKFVLWLKKYTDLMFWDIKKLYLKPTWWK